ncbi:TonB-dependent receptor [Sphingomonas sp. UYEF23]|uniref:TonB-dependent receptor n=1 Tax=Sphingomonas sp. UYEF23 TaxID=1756408 RepID=UPI00339A48D7
MKTLLLVSSALMPGVLHAQAQTSPPAPASLPSPTSPGTASAQAATPETSNGLADIIVTAQRRSENLQTVPIAVAAVSSEQLTAAGITSLQNLRVLVPGLSFSNIQNNVTPRLRGIGSSTAGPGIEPGVAVYVDGVYYASATGALFSFNNVEQVSVLKGPQGTLFGRNAVAGLVQVTTRDPTQEFALQASAGYGNYNTSTGSLYVAGGLAPDVALDLAALVKFQGDGYGRNITLNRDTKRTDHDINLRSKLVFTPGADTKIVLSGDYSNTKGTQGTNRLELGTTPAPGTGPVYGGSVWDVAGDLEGFNNVESGGGSLKIEQGLGHLNLLSITAYRKLYYANALDLDATSTPFQGIQDVQRDQQFSQELQLQSASGGKFKWTVGAFYFKANSKYDPLDVRLLGALIDPMFPLTTIRTFGEQRTESIAGYGQASYEVLPATTLTVGLRYTAETRKADVTRTLGLTSGAFIPVPQEQHDSATFRKPTFRASLDHQFTDVLVYASFNRGFKSGGFNAGQLGAAPFSPEVLDAYETGLKSTLFDRHLTANASVFYYDYSNIQIQRIEQDGSLGIINGAKARAYGLDVDLAAKLGGGFRLTGGIELLSTKFGSFPAAPLSTLQGGTPVRVAPATGNRLPIAPTFTGTLGSDYTYALASGAKLNANATVSYNSGWFTEPDNQIRQPRFVQVNGKLRWTSANDHYSLSVWTDNLTQAKVRANATTVAFGNHVASFAPPRTFGFTAGYKY